MYHNIKSKVTSNGQSSPLFSCENGENLSPISFAIFLNDLESHLLITGSQGIYPKYQYRWIVLVKTTSTSIC